MSDKIIINGDRLNWHAKGYSKVIEVSGWVDNQLKKALKPYGITHAQLNVLHLLSRNEPEPMDAKSLKIKLIVQSPDLTRLLDRLVKKGLVDRKTCPKNRRKIDIKLTDNGSKLFKEVHQIGKIAVNNFFKDNISEEEAKQLFNILNKIK